MTDAAIEQEIQAKGLNAPRVTPQMIDDLIVAENISTADKMFPGCPVTEAMSLLTICVLTLKNGYTVTGESACASPENFDAEIGGKVARQKAKEKIWALEGYALRNRLSA